MLTDDVDADVGPFIRELLGRQKEKGLSGNAFADYLGINRGYWSQLRRGKRPVSLVLITRVLREWPGLAFYLPEELTRREC